MQGHSVEKNLARFCFVIINYQAPEDTISCAASILANNYENSYIVIVDNGSGGGSPEKIKKWAEENSSSGIAVLALPENRGYAAAANEGIKSGLAESSFDFFWILNNDIIFPENTVQKMNSFLASRKDKPAITGTYQLYHDRKGIIQAAAGKFNKFKGAFLNLGEGKKYGEYRAGKVDYIYGASMVISSDFIEKAGLLSEDYFMYYEEIDLAERARRRGFEIAAAEEIFTYHKHALSTSKKGGGFRTFYLERNKALFYRKFYPAYLPFLFIYQIKNFIFSPHKKDFLSGFFQGMTCGIKQKKMLITEFNDHHDETASPLARLLSRDFDVSLRVNSAIADRGLFRGFDVKKTGNGKVKKILSAMGIILEAHLGKFKTIVFNTWGDRYSRLIIRFLPGAVRRIGVAHNTGLIPGKYKKIKYLVLSRYLYERLLKRVSGSAISYFYPLSGVKQVHEPSPAGDEMRVCIPGKIEFSRRDYPELISIAKSLQGVKIKFIILGDSLKADGPEFRRKADSEGVSGFFCFFEGYISYEVFFEEIQKCDVIMPLIHPAAFDYRKYLESKISASFNLAFSFKKPLLLHASFSGIPEFNGRAFFYDDGKAGEFLKGRAETMPAERETGITISDDSEFSDEVQRKRLVSFIDEMNGLQAVKGGHSL